MSTIPRIPSTLAELISSLLMPHEILPAARNRLAFILRALEDLNPDTGLTTDDEVEGLRASLRDVAAHLEALSETVTEKDGAS